MGMFALQRKSSKLLNYVSQMVGALPSPGPLYSKSLNDRNSPPRLDTQVEPYTLQGKSFPDPEIGESTLPQHWSDRNSSLHPTDVKAFT